MCILSFFMLSIPPIRPMPASIQQSSAFIPSSPLLSVFRPTSYSLLSTSLTSSPHLPLKRSRISLPPTTTCTNLPPSPPPPTKSSSAPSFRAIRKLLAALSFIGCLETSYLTFNKLFSSPGTICATQGCLDVLSGPFSSFLGIPLTLFGLLAYAIFAYLCVWPLAADEEEDQNGFLLSVEQVYDARDAATRPLLLALSTSLVVFSGFLMSLLAFVIRSTCPYCFFSAALSAVIFTLTAFVGRAVPKLGDAIRVGTASTALTSLLAAVFFLMSYPVHINAQPPGEPQAPPDITMKSTSDTLRIASKLKEKNTKMYGAYWCSHCYDQKQRFGKKAFQKIEYIECDKHGVNSKFQLCRDKRIPGYPTWEINGELYPGEIDIPELERLVDENPQ